MNLTAKLLKISLCVCLFAHVCVTVVFIENLILPLIQKKNRRKETNVEIDTKTIRIPYFEQQNYGSANLRGYAKQEAAH